MKIFIKLSIIFISVCGIVSVSCTPKMTRDLWNGVYSQRAAVKEYDKKRDEFYTKESVEQKKLRKKNEIICDSVSGAYSGNWNQNKYINCMKERGSPIYRGGN